MSDVFRCQPSQQTNHVSGVLLEERLLLTTVLFSDLSTGPAEPCPVRM
jgi:hypothetical protein